MYVKPRRLGLTWFRLAGGVGGYAAYVCYIVVRGAFLLFDLLAAVVRLRSPSGVGHFVPILWFLVHAGAFFPKSYIPDTTRAAAGYRYPR